MKARTIVPSVTLPSHVSMLTGVGPEAHGVSWNRYEPERGPVKVQTIFEAVREAGLHSVMVAGKEKFRHLVKPGAPDRFEYVEGSAAEAAAMAVRLLVEGQPDLLVLHLRPADDAGHNFGWGNLSAGKAPSPQFLSALEECDAATGVLVEALEREGRWPQTLLIVTADHGGHDDTHGSASDEDVLIPWVAAGGLVTARGKIHAPIVTMDTAATALDALGVAVPASWEGRPVRVLARPPLRKAA
jgi:arylsulfatase A-like enzyme